MSDKLTLAKQIARAAETTGRTPSPRLSALAAYINERFPELEADVEPAEFSTDRHYKNSRLRWPGKGRKGNRLTVYRRSDPWAVRAGRNGHVFQHNAAETYRANWEVCRWIVDYERSRVSAEPGRR